MRIDNLDPSGIIDFFEMTKSIGWRSKSSSENTLMQISGKVCVQNAPQSIIRSWIYTMNEPLVRKCI